MTIEKPALDTWPGSPLLYLPFPRIAVACPMPKFLISDVLAGPRTDAFIHLWVFSRADRPVPPYSTDPESARRLAERYGLSTVPVRSMGSDAVEGHVVVRRVEARHGPMGRWYEFETLAEGETIPLAIARAVHVIEGLAEPGFLVEDL